MAHMVTTREINCQTTPQLRSMKLMSCQQGHQKPASTSLATTVSFPNNSATFLFEWMAHMTDTRHSSPNKKWKDPNRFDQHTKQTCLLRNTREEREQRKEKRVEKERGFKLSIFEYSSQEKKAPHLTISVLLFSFLSPLFKRQKTAPYC